MTTTTHLEVCGIAWSGCRAVYSYTLPSGAPVPQSCEEAGKHAGDFQAVTDFRVVRESNTYESLRSGLWRRIDEFKTLRGFRNGMTPRRFYRLANGFA